MQYTTGKAVNPPIGEAGTREQAVNILAEKLT